VRHDEELAEEEDAQQQLTPKEKSSNRGASKTCQPQQPQQHDSLSSGRASRCSDQRFGSRHPLGHEENQFLYIQLELCQSSLSEISEEQHELPEHLIWDYMIDLLLVFEKFLSVK
jgi:hypothetical protein